MMPKHITLEEWLRATYGDAFGIDTARRWCRTGRITPEPQKVGGHYFVSPDARYTDRPAGKPRLIDRLRAEATQAG